MCAQGTSLHIVSSFFVCPQILILTINTDKTFNEQKKLTSVPKEQEVQHSKVIEWLVCKSFVKSLYLNWTNNGRTMMDTGRRLLFLCPASFLHPYACYCGTWLQRKGWARRSSCGKSEVITSFLKLTPWLRREVLTACAGRIDRVNEFS